MRAPPPRLPRPRRPRRLRRAAAAAPRDHLGALRRGHPAARAWRARTATWREDFLDLTFALESGEKLDRPAALRDAGPGLPALARARRLPRRPRGAARAAARRGRASTSPRPATRRRRRSSSRRCRRRRSPGSSPPPPASSCRARPTGASFLRRRSGERLRWSDQATLERAAIFLPLDTTPQDVRDCLNEEITQALGPANDLYRLPDSIWNDDNFHGMATPFDMLILRALYQPELAQRHDRAPRWRRALPRVLDRMNPQGPRRCRGSRAQPESRGLGRARSRRRCRATRRAASGWPRRRSRRRSPPRCARSTTGSASRC